MDNRAEFIEEHRPEFGEGRGEGLVVEPAVVEIAECILVERERDRAVVPGMEFGEGCGEGFREELAVELAVVEIAEFILVEREKDGVVVRGTEFGEGRGTEFGEGRGEGLVVEFAVELVIGSIGPVIGLLWGLSWSLLQLS